MMGTVEMAFCGTIRPAFPTDGKYARPIVMAEMPKTARTTALAPSQREPIFRGPSPPGELHCLELIKPERFAYEPVEQ
jgi:hypothetical protein